MVRSRILIFSRSLAVCLFRPGNLDQDLLVEVVEEAVELEGALAEEEPLLCCVAAELLETVAGTMGAPLSLLRDDSRHSKSSGSGTPAAVVVVVAAEAAAAAAERCAGEKLKESTEEVGDRLLPVALKYPESEAWSQAGGAQQPGPIRAS